MIEKLRTASRWFLMCALAGSTAAVVAGTVFCMICVTRSGYHGYLCSYSFRQFLVGLVGIFGWAFTGMFALIMLVEWSEWAFKTTDTLQKPEATE